MIGCTKDTTTPPGSPRRHSKTVHDRGAMAFCKTASRHSTMLPHSIATTPTTTPPFRHSAMHLTLTLTLLRITPPASLHRLLPSPRSSKFCANLRLRYCDAATLQRCDDFVRTCRTFRSSNFVRWSSTTRRRSVTVSPHISVTVSHSLSVPTFQSLHPCHSRQDIAHSLTHCQATCFSQLTPQ